MNVKAVIDTNVLVSAYWTRNSDSPPARVYRALFSGRWGPTSSAARNRDQTQIALRGGCGRPRTSAPTGGDAPRRFRGQMRENEAIREAWKRVHEQRD